MVLRIFTPVCTGEGKGNASKFCFARNCEQTFSFEAICSTVSSVFQVWNCEERQKYFYKNIVLWILKLSCFWLVEPNATFLYFISSARRFSSCLVQRSLVVTKLPDIDSYQIDIKRKEKLGKYNFAGGLHGSVNHYMGLYRRLFTSMKIIWCIISNTDVHDMQHGSPNQ